MPSLIHQCSQEELAAIFNEYDLDHNGYLHIDEFRSAMKRLGNELHSRTVKTIFSALGNHEKGRLDLDEFIAIVEAEELRSHDSVVEMWRSHGVRPSWWTDPSDRGD